MKKMLQLALILLVIVAATGTDAQTYFIRENYIDYYLDDAFLDWAGYNYRYCDGTVDTDNQVASWRVWDSYNCSTGSRVIHRCQQTDGMGGWISVTCPPNHP